MRPGQNPPPVTRVEPLEAGAGAVAPGSRRFPTKGRPERRRLAPVTGADKSLCSRAQRQTPTPSAPTTWPPFLGHWDQAGATSRQFDGAPGRSAGRRDPRRVVTLSEKPRHGETPPPFSSDEVHLTRFVERVRRNSGGVRGRRSRRHSSGFAIFLPDFREAGLFVTVAQCSMHDTRQKTLA